MLYSQKQIVKNKAEETPANGGSNIYISNNILLRLPLKPKMILKQNVLNS